MKISVKDLRIVEKGSLRGFCTVVFPDSGLEFRDVRIIQGNGQEAFVTGPQREYEKDGQKKYVALVYWPKESKIGSLISQAVLQEWEKKKGEPRHAGASSGGYTTDIPF